MDETDSVNQKAGDTDVTSRIQAIRNRAMLEEITEGTTGRRRYRPAAAYVRWAQSVLSWLRGRSRASR